MLPAHLFQFRLVGGWSLTGSSGLKAGKLRHAMPLTHISGVEGDTRVFRENSGRGGKNLTAPDRGLGQDCLLSSTMKPPTNLLEDLWLLLFSTLLGSWQVSLCYSNKVRLLLEMENTPA